MSLCQSCWRSSKGLSYKLELSSSKKPLRALDECLAHIVHVERVAERVEVGTSAGFAVAFNRVIELPGHLVVRLSAWSIKEFQFRSIFASPGTLTIGLDHHHVELTRRQVLHLNKAVVDAVLDDVADSMVRRYPGRRVSAHSHDASVSPTRDEPAHDKKVLGGHGHIHERCVEPEEGIGRAESLALGIADNAVGFGKDGPLVLGRIILPKEGKDRRDLLLNSVAKYGIVVGFDCQLLLWLERYRWGLTAEHHE